MNPRTRPHCHRQATGWISVVLGATLMCVLTGGCAGTRPSWETTRRTHTIDGYVTFSRRNPDSPHLEESRIATRSLVSDYLAKVRDVAVLIDPTNSPPSGCEMRIVQRLLSDSLTKHGYDASLPDSVNRLVVSVRRVRLFQGTAESFWHAAVVWDLELGYEHAQYGRLFMQSYKVSDADLTTSFEFSDVAFEPLDSESETYFSPDTGGMWGAGIRMIQTSTAPGSTTTARAIREYDWDALLSWQRFLTEIGEQLQERDPLAITDATEWKL